MLAKRWIGNVPMMVKVYRWCRGCHSPRLQALRLAWGLSGLEVSTGCVGTFNPGASAPGSV